MRTVVVGGLQVASGAVQTDDVQAFIQYSRQFAQPSAQLECRVKMLQCGVAPVGQVI